MAGSASGMLSAGPANRRTLFACCTRFRQAYLLRDDSPLDDLLAEQRGCTPFPGLDIGLVHLVCMDWASARFDNLIAAPLAGSRGGMVLKA